MKKFIKYFGVLLVAGMFLTGCNNGTKEKDYSGTYKNDNSDQMTITKNDSTYKANISLYRLTTLENCNVDNIENDVLNISCTDDSVGTIKFKFDYNKKTLTVTESSWSLLNNSDNFEFNK